jgi:DMSO reductase anchor subunit
MHPAPSIVFFTTASGAGYGLLFWLGLLLPTGLLSPPPVAAVVALLLALALISAGLLSSTLHLGRPERAWRALSQWRSSWLSREGVAALATYPPALLLGLALWRGDGVLALVGGLLSAAGAVVTVWCTGMIYASLRTVRQWRHALVPWGYLLFAAFSGAALLAAVAAFSGNGALPAALAALLGLGALILKRAYWSGIDAAPAADSPTIESATGLGRIGATRPLDPPHTEQNWLLREMGFRIARKHRLRLRVLVQAGFVLAVALAALSLLLPAAAPLLLLAGAVVALLALLAERWLIFAEATHTVTLYYTGER